MELTRDAYRVQYDETSGIITCQGSFRLRGGKEDQAILDLLTRPDLLKQVRSEWEELTKGKPYESPLPPGAVPPVPKATTQP